MMFRLHTRNLMVSHPLCNLRYRTPSDTTLSVRGVFDVGYIGNVEQDVGGIFSDVGYIGDVEQDVGFYFGGIEQDVG
jgi:hypothetical protein